MAETLTFQYASFNNGEVVVEYDIRDNNWVVTQVRCINNSDYPAVGTIYELGEVIFTAVAPANETTSWNVVGIQLSWQPDYWDGEQWIPSGIEMGDYELAAQWPAEVV